MKDLKKFIATTIREFLSESNSFSNDYVAPNNKIVYRAEHSNRKGNWFAFSKDDAIGYVNYNDKIIKKNISKLKFININKILSGGEYFEDLITLYPNLFKVTNDEIWKDYDINVGLTQYFETIKPFLVNKGYNGVFTNKKLSIDYEVYVF